MKQQKKMETKAKIDIIRHARTQWNIEKRIQGKTDIPLCEEGVRDAAAWASQLACKKYDRIISSPLIRARETALKIGAAAGIEVQIVEGIKEQGFGRWEGRQLAEIRNQSPGEVESRESDGWGFCPPEGESRNAVLTRALASISDIARTSMDKNVLMVTHSSVMKIIIYHVLGHLFLAGQTSGSGNIIKPWHLHQFFWDGGLTIRALNALDLSSHRTENRKNRLKAE